MASGKKTCAFPLAARRSPRPEQPFSSTRVTRRSFVIPSRSGRCAFRDRRRRLAGREGEVSHASLDVVKLAAARW